jgi:hypothetical protein
MMYINKDRNRIRDTIAGFGMEAGADFSFRDYD